MKLLKQLLLATALLAPLAVLAESVVVIVHPSNKVKLSQKEVKAIYSDNIITWRNGKRIRTYDLPVRSKARQEFSKKVMGKSARSVARDWANRKITNTAKNPPRTKKEKLAILSVARNRNAIAYVPASMVKGRRDVRVLMKVK